MVIWFLVGAPVIVAEVFRSPMVDYRMVALGAILPLIEVLIGRPAILHTLVAPVALMAVVMAATTGRRLVRRRLLGIPIGLFLHLVLDGTWSQTELFWWPAFGFRFDDAQLPETAAGIVLPIMLELVGVGLAVWAWRRYGLGDRENRSLLLRRGHLNRAVLR